MKDLLCGVAIGYILFTNKGRDMSRKMGEEIKELIKSASEGNTEIDFTNLGRTGPKLPEEKPSCPLPANHETDSLPGKNAS